MQLNNLSDKLKVSAENPALRIFKPLAALEKTNVCQVF